MYLRAAQTFAFVINVLGSLAPVAAAVLLWSDHRALSWVSLGVFAIGLLFGQAIAAFGITSLVVGTGLRAYAVADRPLLAVLAAIGAALAYYLIAWQVHRAKRVSGFQ